MATINIKMHEFNAFQQKGYSARKATQFKNNIITSLKQIGIREDDINVPLEAVVIKKAPASVSWYQEGRYLYFSYKNSIFIENLHAVSKVIELETQALLNDEKTKEEFISAFTEDLDIEEKRKEARNLLGVDENCVDLGEINKRYKDLAKECHPDKGGDMEKFQVINTAHKMLKRELE